MRSIVHTGTQHRDEIRTSHVKNPPVAMSSAQNRVQNKPIFYTKRAQSLYCTPLRSKNFLFPKILKINPNRETHGKRSL